MQKYRLLLLFLFILFLPRDSFGYGLKIQPGTATPTTLLLDNGRPIRLRDELKISFRFHIDSLSAGSILKIVSNREEVFAMELIPGDHETLSPAFIINEEIYTFPAIETPDGWVSAAITLSPLNKLVTLDYEGKQKHLPYSFEKRTFLRMAFGYCPFEGYESTGVAAVTLRDIRLQQNGLPFRYWQLEAHADTLCYDSVIYMPASITNPYWIVNKGGRDTPEAYRQAEPDDLNGYGVIWKMLLFVGAVFILTAAVMQFLYIKNRRRVSNK